MAHRPLVYVQPALPTLILATNNGLFVIDSNGKALITDTSSAVSRLKLPLLHDQSGVKIQPNHQALSKANIDFVQNIIGQLYVQFASGAG